MKVKKYRKRKFRKWWMGQGMVRHWNPYLGLKICRFRTTTSYRYRNLGSNPYCIDHRKNYSLIVKGEDIREEDMEDGYSFMDWLQEIIETEFNGLEGIYWVGGRYEEDKTRFFKVPVIMVDYYGNRLHIIKKRTFRRRYGRKKKKSRTYYAIKKWDYLDQYG